MKGERLGSAPIDTLSDLGIPPASVEYMGEAAIWHEAFGVYQDGHSNLDDVGAAEYGTGGCGLVMRPAELLTMTRTAPQML